MVGTCTSIQPLMLSNVLLVLYLCTYSRYLVPAGRSRLSSLGPSADNPCRPRLTLDGEPQTRVSFASSRIQQTWRERAPDHEAPKLTAAWREHVSAARASVGCEGLF